MKKVVSAVAALGLSALILSGCGQNSVSPSVDSGPVENTTLTFMMPQTHYKDFLKASLAQFEREHPGIHIEVQAIPDNQWTNLVQTKMAVRETPDLIRIDKSLIADVGPENFVELTDAERWYSRVLPAQLENKKIDGKLYGLPVSSTSSIGIVYNRALFKQYGVEYPANFEELKTACQAFKEKGLVPLYASDKDSWTVQIGINAAATQTMPADSWEKLMKGTLHWTEIPELETVLSDFADLRRLGYTNADYIEGTYESAVSAMAQGQAAMCITGQFFVNDVLKQNPEADLMMMPVPYQKDVLTVIEGPGQISIYKNSPHIEEAKVFLDWFSQPDNMDVFNGGWSHLPVFKDQNLKMSEWQQRLYDDYVSQGRTVTQIDEKLTGVDLNDFWGYQQEMMGGALDAKQVLEKWDASFADQMRDKEAPGWS